MCSHFLSTTHQIMKSRFDQKAIPWQFQPGDKVPVLLLEPGSALTAPFAGPYVVDHR